MRLNIYERESWSPLQHELNTYAKVLLNGVECKYVTCADEEQGYVDRIVTDAKGRFVRDGDEFKTERLNGVVRIKDTRDEYRPTR